MCGAVRYEATDDPTWCGYCHCHSCRAHTGAPVVAFICYDADKTKWTTGVPRRYESSPGIFRAFCGDCGTPLTWEGNLEGVDEIEFHISTLDNPDEFPPTEHLFYAEKISWFEVDDDLHRRDRGSLD